MKSLLTTTQPYEFPDPEGLRLLFKCKSLDRDGNTCKRIRDRDSVLQNPCEPLSSKQLHALILRLSSVFLVFVRTQGVDCM